MKEAICANPLFGITLSIAAYALGQWLYRKTKLAILNPLLVSYLVIIPVLQIFDIPLEWYEEGGDVINLFLAPATAVLAITVYQQRAMIRTHLVAIVAGSIVASLSSLASVWLLCHIFALDTAVVASLLPKSITTPMAIAVSSSLGGIQAITVLAVILTGICGSIIGPVLIKAFRIEDEVVQGLALGASSHAVGTSKALEMGEVQGALSSVSLVSCGIVTVILSLFLV